jgi:hypothetical protein
MNNTPPSFRGAGEAGEPGIHGWITSGKSAGEGMDSGLARCARAPE